jgi:serine/threonine-protein kinase
MGLSSWLRAKLGLVAPIAAERARATESAFVAPVPTHTGAQQLREALAARRFDDARALFARALDGDEEADVLETALAALSSRTALASRDARSAPAALAEPADVDDAALDRFRIRLAEALVARGARVRASDVLAEATTPAAWMLRADLLAEGLSGAGSAPTSHDLDRALALLGRALRADFDAPGVRERWERLRVRVGGGPAAAPVDVGATLLVSGKALPYLLRREVARGGAGVVYEAEERLGPVARTIALKLAHAGGTSREQLGHEARLAVRFRGPAVVPIFDVDPDAGWLATPWMAGMSLRERLRAPLTPAHHTGASDAPHSFDASPALSLSPLAWLVPVVEALCDVHAAGWVHGDVKPANVLFDAEGGAWLSDFALARPIGAASTPGSAGYVSNERIAGAPASPRDDVFGVGRIVEALIDAGWGGDARHHLARIAARATAEAASRPVDARALLALIHA